MKTYQIHVDPYESFSSLHLGQLSPDIPLHLLSSMTRLDRLTAVNIHQTNWKLPATTLDALLLLTYSYFIIKTRERSPQHR